MGLSRCWLALSMSNLVLVNADCGGGAAPGPWAGNSACISNNGGATYAYHCPWESSMLVSAKKFGGCNSVKYDCANTNTAVLLATYEAHSTAASPPPEGGPAFVKYTMCCIRANCPTYTYVNDVTCGAVPIVRPHQSRPLWSERDGVRGNLFAHDCQKAQPNFIS